MLILFSFLLVFSLKISCSLRSGTIFRNEPVEVVSSTKITSNSSLNGRQKLKQEIVTFAIKQLGLESDVSSIDFNSYEIENWPEFVPYSFKIWDRQSCEDLRKALPNLIFKRKQPVATRRSNGAKVLVPNRMINRHKLAIKLLQLFNEQTGLNYHVVPWSCYNVIDWPAGVSLDLNHLKAQEVLAVARNLHQIKFTKVARKEPRTITYTDGTTVIVRGGYKSMKNTSRNKEQKKTEKRGKQRKRKYNYSSESSESEPEYFDSETSEEDEQENENNYSAKRKKESDFETITSALDEPIEIEVEVSDDDEALKHYNPDLDSFSDADVTEMK